MSVEKLGDGFATRIPEAVADAPALREGEYVLVRLAESRTSEVGRNNTRQDALDRIKSFRLKLSKDWRFDRDDANLR